jgi:hypothetical protein
VEPPAPKVTEKNSGLSNDNCFRVAVSFSMPSGVCGGKNSKLIKLEFVMINSYGAIGRLPIVFIFGNQQRQQIRNNAVKQCAHHSHPEAGYIGRGTCINCSPWFSRGHRVAPDTPEGRCPSQLRTLSPTESFPGSFASTSPGCKARLGSSRSQPLPINSTSRRKELPLPPPTHHQQKATKTHPSPPCCRS